MKYYTIVIDYFATGEGRHLWFGIMPAKDETEAKLFFKSAFKQFDEKTYWAYFSLDLEVTEGIHNYAEILSESQIEWIKLKQECGITFYFNMDLNCS